MKTLLSESIVLWALFPGSDEDDFVPETDVNSSGAGDELNPDDDERYIDVDAGEDEEIDEEDAIRSDQDAYEAEETAEDEEDIDDDEDLNENEELRSEGAPQSIVRGAQRETLQGAANDLINSPPEDRE